jgi:peptidoglycan/LPS O-acetylase OafA/YrhL
LALFSSAIAFTDADQFPGLRAAIPVLATAILITFSPDTKLQRLLSIPPLCIQETSATPSIYGTGRSWCLFNA